MVLDHVIADSRSQYQTVTGKESVSLHMGLWWFLGVEINWLIDILINCSIGDINLLCDKPFCRCVDSLLVESLVCNPIRNQRDSACREIHLLTFFNYCNSQCI